MPTFPITVNAGTVNFAPQCPPFQIGTDRYAVSDGGGGSIGTFIYRSTDGGSTWNMLDASNGPVGSAEGWCHDTINHQLIIVTNSVSVTVALSYFDLLSNTWGLKDVDTGTPVVNISGIAFVTAVPQLIVTSFFNAGHESPDVAQYMTCNIDGSGSSGFIDLGDDPTTDWTCNGTLICGMRAHFVLLKGLNFGAGTRNLCQQPLPNGGSLGSVQIVDTNGDGSTAPFQTTFYGSTDGTNVSLIWYPTLNALNVVVFEGVSADTITFASQTLPFTNVLLCTGIAVSSGDTYAFVVTQNMMNISLYSANDIGAGFGAFVLEGTTNIVFSYIAANGMTTHPWGVVLNGSVYYWESGINPPAPGGPSTGVINTGNGGVLPVLLPDPLLHCKFHIPLKCDRNNRVMIATKVMTYERGFVTHAS